MASDELDKLRLLLFERQVSVGFAPIAYRPERTGNASLAGDLANDSVASSRPFPWMGEAEKVKRRVRIVSAHTLAPEFHVVGLGLINHRAVKYATYDRNAILARIQLDTSTL